MNLHVHRTEFGVILYSSLYTIQEWQEVFFTEIIIKSTKINNIQKKNSCKTSWKLLGTYQIYILVIFTQILLTL